MSNNLFSIQGKVAVVTGAGSGLGYMISKEFVEQGCTVYGVGRRIEKLEEAADKLNSGNKSGKFVPLPGDLSSKDGIAKVISDFAKSESKLNILINAAGVLHVDPIKSHPDDVENLAKSLWSAEESGWKNSFDVNVSALYFTSVGFLPYLRAAFEANPSTDDDPKETPIVINIGSVAGVHNARDAASVSYQTSKSAVTHLTKCLATRFIPMRVRCCAIHPGLFPTEMSNPDPKEIRKTHHIHFRAMPEGRAGAPEDIVGPCIFFASRAGAYCNANILDVSGGRTLMLSGAILPDASE